MNRCLGYLNLKENQITTQKNNIKSGLGVHLRPADFKNTEKNNPELIFIWGDEHVNELIKKVNSQNIRKSQQGVIMLIYATLISFQKQKLISFFNSLKKFDNDLYSSLPKEMQIAKKWWNFW